MALMRRTSLCIRDSMGLLAGTADALLSTNQSIDRSIVNWFTFSVFRSHQRKQGPERLQRDVVSAGELFE